MSSVAARPSGPAAATAAPAAELEPVPMDLGSPQLTVRAVLTGMLLGAVLSLCNIYGGLKVGWGFNMSITAALLAFGFWRGVQQLGGRPFGLLENNINQTAASSAAYISSAGLVAPIPALTILTGQVLGWAELALWCFAVCAVGIAVGIGLRRQMIEVDRLPFASGIAAASTLKEMYARGAEAMARVRALLTGAVVAAGIKIAEALVPLAKLGLPGSVAAKAGGGSYSLYNLTFALEPSLLMVGVGAIIGFRTGVSLLLGAVVAYGFLAPLALDAGWAGAGGADAAWFGSLTKWLLWPGVSMMVTSALTSFAFSWRSMASAFRRTAPTLGAQDRGEVPRPLFLAALGLALVLATVLQVALFGIHPVIAVLGVLFTFVLAIVAGRVSGETAITPVGPMGKVTQLIFGVLAPGQPAANLMTANVTGGAASQCADLLHDLKAGQLVGAMPRRQTFAQYMGAIAGALAGSAAYLVLVPDPRRQLLTDEWPAPAAAAWKAVAELFQKGFEAMPGGALTAMIVAGVAGVVLAVAEKVVPARARVFIPSPAALGLALVIPAWNSISMFLGGAAAIALTRAVPSWSARFLIVVASGLIAGESITGVGLALASLVE